jgi:hypothetical protein
MLSRFGCAVALLCVASIVATGQDKKTASAIIVDNTGSMRPYLDSVLAIGGEAVKTLSQRGPVSIFSFELHRDGEKELGSLNSGSTWYTENRKLWEKLNAITTQPGQTQLIDAIDGARGVLASKISAEKLDEGIIFIVTDGEDRASDTKIKQLLENLNRDHIKVLAVGLVDSVPDKKKATKLLKQLASGTGGNAIFPNLTKQQRYEPLITEIFAVPTK